MPEAEGRIDWPRGGAEGLMIQTIHSPAIATDAAFAVLVSSVRGPLRQAPRRGEDVETFARRLTNLAKLRPDIEVLKLFLPPVAKRRALGRRVRLDD